jgi:hypothetical protein
MPKSEYQYCRLSKPASLALCRSGVSVPGAGAGDATGSVQGDGAELALEYDEVGQ